jgi:hypothetical protein
MKKPNAHGPSPSRKAHLALREKLNRKFKPAPPLPEEKKSAAHLRLIIENKARYVRE